MPAGWRTLGAPKSKRNKDRRRKRLSRTPSSTYAKEPTPEVGVAKSAGERSELGFQEEHEEKTNESTLPLPPTERSDTARELPPSSPSSPSAQEPMENEPEQEQEVEEQRTPEKRTIDEAVGRRQKSPSPPSSPSWLDRSPQRPSSLQSISPELTSPSKRNSTPEKSAVKPRQWQSSSFNVSRRPPKGKKKESPLRESIPPAKPVSPEQRAGAVQGIAMSWKNEFSKDAKKKIEQVKLSQLWKSLKSSSSPKPSSSNVNERPEKREPPKLRSKPTMNKEIIPPSRTTAPPTGMTPQGGRSPMWWKMQRPLSKPKPFAPPKLSENRPVSKLNPFVKEFTPKNPSYPRSYQSTRVWQKHNMKPPEPTQPFIQQSSEMYDRTVPMYRTDSTNLMMSSNPSLMTMQNVVMGGAIPRTTSYELINDQNVSMVSPMTMNQSSGQLNRPSMLSAGLPSSNVSVLPAAMPTGNTPMLTSVPHRNMHNFVVSYPTTQNRPPMATPQWQGQSQPVATIPNMRNSGVTGKLQQRFSGVQQQQHGFSSSPATNPRFNPGFSPNRIGGQPLAQQLSTNFNSQYVRTGNQSISTPKPTWSPAKEFPSFRPKETALWESRALKPTSRPIMHRVQVPGQSRLETRHQHKNSDPIQPTSRTLEEDEERKTRSNESQRTQSPDESLQWSLPKTENTSNGFPTGIFTSSSTRPLSTIFVSKKQDWNEPNNTLSESSSMRSTTPQLAPDFWDIPHTQVFAYLTVSDLAKLSLVSRSMSQKVHEVPYITSMIVDGKDGIIGINTIKEGKGKWAHDLERVMGLFSGRGVRTIELEPSNYVNFFWTRFLDWLTKDRSDSVDSILVHSSSCGEEENAEVSGARDFLIGLSPREIKIRSGIEVDAKLLRDLDRPGVKALVFSREIKWNNEMIEAVSDRMYPLSELTLACAPRMIVPWLPDFQRLEKLRLLHDPSDKSRLLDQDLVTILSTVRAFEVDCSLLSTRGLPSPALSMVTESLTILTTCGETISRSWLEKSLKKVPPRLRRFHLKNLSEPLSLNHLDDVPLTQSKANIEKLEGLSMAGVQITGEQCHDCRVLGLDYCLVIV